MSICLLGVGSTQGIILPLQRDLTWLASLPYTCIPTTLRRTYSPVRLKTTLHIELQRTFSRWWDLKTVFSGFVRLKSAAFLVDAAGGAPLTLYTNGSLYLNKCVANKGQHRLNEAYGESKAAS